jgi:hypothetical protein
MTMTASTLSFGGTLEQHLLGAALHVEHALLFRGEHAGGFQHEIDAKRRPSQSATDPSPQKL